MWSLVMSAQGPPDSRGLGQLLIPVAAVIAVLLIIIIVILLFPRLRNVKSSKPIEAKVKKIEEGKAAEKNATEKPLDVTLRLLSEDERRIVELLVKNGGQMLQKDISYELKLNRVKTHRVLVGLIERGVVGAEKHFNTNMITLAEWLREGSTGSKN
jgi:uncharacterized membrane protein